MKKKQVTQELEVVPVVRTIDELLGAAQEFLQASLLTVGENRTFDTLTFLTKTINDSPDTYQKIFHPNTLGKINELVESTNSGKKMGMMDLVGTVMELAETLK